MGNATSSIPYRAAVSPLLSWEGYDHDSMALRSAWLLGPSSDLSVFGNCLSWKSLIAFLGQFRYSELPVRAIWVLWLHLLCWFRQDEMQWFTNHIWERWCK